MGMFFTRGRLLAALRLFALVALVALPQYAFAQEGNPFADAGAQSFGLGLLASLRFWVWLAFGIGVVFFVIAYALQGLVPDLYNSVRSWIRNGVLLILAFGLVMEFIIAQATAAQGL